MVFHVHEYNLENQSIFQKHLKLLKKFNNDVDSTGKSQALENFINADPIPYNEWFGSKKSFVDVLSEDDWRFETLYEKALKKKRKEQFTQSVQTKIKISETKGRNWWKLCPKCGSKLEKFGKYNVQCSNPSCNYNR